MKNYSLALRSPAVLLLVVAGVLAFSPRAAAEPLFVDRHIIVLHDISGSVTRRRAELGRIREYLLAMTFNGLTRQEVRGTDVLDQRRVAPLAGPDTAFTFFTFGADREPLRRVLRHAPSLWLPEFSRVLLSRDSFRGPSTPAAARQALEAFLARASQQATNYTLSRYIFPLVLAELPEEVYAKETLLMVISDFRYGESQDNIGDREAVQAIMGAGFLNLLEGRHAELQEVFTLSPPLFDLNVGGLNGIFIRGLRVLPRSPLAGEFMDLQKDLVLRRTEREPAFQVPPLVYQATHLPAGVKVRHLGLRLKSDPSRPPLWLTRPPVAEGNRFVVRLSPLAPEIFPDQNLPRQGNFFIAGEYVQERWRLSFFQQSPPVVLTWETEPSWETIFKRWYVLAMLAVGLGGLLYILFFRRRRLRVAFPTRDGDTVLRTTRWFQDKECQLFECEPGVSGEKARILVHLARKPGWLNFSSRTNATVTARFSRGGYPVQEVVFEDNNDREIKLKKIGRHGVKLYLLLTLEGITEEGLWKYDDLDSREPFVITLTADYPDRDCPPATLYGLPVRKSDSLWLGLDPGTTGCCVFAGRTSADLAAVPLLDGQVIMPSIVHLLSTYNLHAQEPYQEGGCVVGRPHIAGSLRTFSSVKRLIGYKNVYKVPLDSGEVNISGELIQSILVDYMVSQAAAALPADPAGNHTPPRQAVVAVPNSFTPAKINRMLACCLKARHLERVEHIFEIEAIILAYYRRKGAEKSLPLTALVIDFGGSTLNVAVATLSRDEQQVHVDMHSRLGFNLGGDTLTAIIAEQIWENSGHRAKFLQDRQAVWGDKEFPSPFLPAEQVPLNIRQSWEALRRDLWDAAEYVKTHWPSPNYPGLEEAAPLQEFLATIRDNIQEVVDIYRGSQEKPVDLVLRAGRASLFGPFQEQIRAVIDSLAEKSGLRPQEEMLSDQPEDFKLCVAEGAAFYAVQRRNIRLTRDKTFGHYGFELFYSINQEDRNFVSLIPMGQPFINGECSGEARNIDLRFNHNQLSFYQIMAADPLKGMANKYRHSLLQRFNLAETDTTLKEAYLSINVNDQCKIEIKTANHFIQNERNFLIDDICSEMDKYTTWRLV